MNPVQRDDAEAFSVYGARYPQLFRELRGQGAGPGQATRMMPYFSAVGRDTEIWPGTRFIVEFLNYFGGVVCKRLAEDGRAFQVAIGDLDNVVPLISRMDLFVGILCIQRLGAEDAYPAMNCNGDLGFILGDSSALIVGANYEWFARCDDPFQLLQWSLFQDAAPPLRVQEIPPSVRPPVIRP